MTNWATINAQFETVVADPQTLQDETNLALFPGTAVLDNFTRTAETPLSDGGNWITTGNGWGGQPHLLQTNGTEAVAGTATAGSTWDTAYSAPVEIYVDVPTMGSQFIFGWSSSTNGSLVANEDYYLIATATGWTLKNLGSALDGGSWTFSSGDSAGLLITDKGRITAYHKTGGVWTQISAVTDTNFSGPGYLGLVADDTTVAFANFGGGNP